MIRIYFFLKIYVLLMIATFAAIALFAQETRQLAVDKPTAIADLKTQEGAALVSAKWYVQPAYIKDADFKSPSAGTNGDLMLLYPTGMKIKTHTLSPQISSSDFARTRP